SLLAEEIYPGAAPARASAAEARRRGKEPGSGAKSKITAQQGSDRTNVHGVPGIVGVQRGSGEDVDSLVRTAAEDPQLRLFGHLVHEANAAGAKDAALLVQYHQGAEDLSLVAQNLPIVQSRRLEVVLHVVILELALTRLIAD